MQKQHGGVVSVCVLDTLRFGWIKIVRVKICQEDEMVSYPCQKDGNSLGTMTGKCTLSTTIRRKLRGLTLETGRLLHFFFLFNFWTYQQYFCIISAIVNYFNNNLC